VLAHVRQCLARRARHGVDHGLGQRVVDRSHRQTDVVLCQPPGIHDHVAQRLLERGRPPMGRAFDELAQCGCLASGQQSDLWAVRRRVAVAATRDVLEGL
jgi:hypothetical protein